MRRLHERAANINAAEMPKCAACQFGKQTNCVTPGLIGKALEGRQGVLSADKSLPGERVFVDHFQCAARGRTLVGDGKCNHDQKSASASDMEHGCCGGCTFVDTGTGHIAVEFQSTLNKQDTIKAIERYKAKAKDYGIIVKECQFDNGGAFTSKQLRETLSQRAQKFRCAGAGSHHQNGRAEQAIRTVMAMARTMLIRQAAHWQQKLDSATKTSRWPVGVQLATHI